MQAANKSRWSEQVNVDCKVLSTLFLLDVILGRMLEYARRAGIVDKSSFADQPFFHRSLAPGA